MADTSVRARLYVHPAMLQASGLLLVSDLSSALASPMPP
eukprot:COSAG02_NODE_59745_length_273_cov_0.833333_1_plen_38_part_01